MRTIAAAISIWCSRFCRSTSQRWHPEQATPSPFSVRRRIGGANHHFDFRSSPMFLQMETI
jgi:hypothetical protein